MEKTKQTSNKAIEKDVYEIITRFCPTQAPKLTNNLNLKKDLNLDSIDIAELVYTLAAELKVNIDDTTIAYGIFTVDDIIKCVYRHKQNEH